MDFNDKVVVITGASAGIGAETAIHLASLGASLALTGRNAFTLRRTSDKCKKASGGKEPFYFTGDLSKESEAEKFVKETIAKYGRIDVLVNNAADGDLGSAETNTLEVYDDIVSTNLRPVVYLTKLAVPHLIESKGNVINVTIIASMTSDVTAYLMIKAALDTFTKCLALELGAESVRVNAVNPGIIENDILMNYLTIEDKVSDSALEKVKQITALGRFGEPKDVSAAIVFLASGLASNMTGVTLPVDGGANIVPAMS